MYKSTGVLLGAILVLVVSLVAPMAQETDAPKCGNKTISVARMPWPSAAILANIHVQILAQEYDCEARLVSGDMAATISSMAAGGQPAVVPELWAARIATVWNAAVAAGAVRQTVSSYSDGDLEGWFIPSHTAAASPELKSIADLPTHLDGLATTGGKVRFLSCPPDWACAIINRNLVAALGLTDRLEIIEPANRFEFDTLIGQAMSREENLLFYYWQPNAVLAQFSFEGLDMGPFGAEAFACLGTRNCADPKPTRFAPEPVVVVVADWVQAEAPEVAAYFRRTSMPIAEMNQLLAWQSAQEASEEDTARRFVQEREEIWRKWVLGN